ncbi:MAG: hypothetical protein HZA02_03175 [Nitrospinae bacterium]|nr:hypothetical protein [Nitrospinota bacterium]
MRDMKNNVDAVTSINPAAQTATVNGAGVDLRGFESAMVVFHPGTIADGTHTPKIQESDDNSAFTDVAADQQGTLTALASNTVQRVGYIGSKRYIRAVSTVAGATTGGVYGALVLRGSPNIAPAA